MHSTINHYLPFSVQILATSFASIIGLSGIRSLAPGGTRPFLQHFGLPSSSDPLTEALVKLSSARNLMFGVAVLAFQIQGNVRAMGTVFLAGLVIPAADAYVAYTYGSGAESHIWGGVVSGVIGGYLVWIG